MSIGEVAAQLRAVIASCPPEELLRAVERLENARALIMAATEGSNAWEPPEIVALLTGGIASSHEALHQILQAKVIIEGYLERVVGGGEVGASASATSSPPLPPVPTQAGKTTNATKPGTTNDPELLARFAEATKRSPQPVPPTWEPRITDNGKGVVFQRPGAEDNVDMIRVMDPSDLYPAGHVRVYNSYGQPVDQNGKPGSRAATHISLDNTDPWPWRPEG